MNVFVIALRESYISPAFREESFTARCSAVRLFIIAHSITYRMGTHTLQRPPAEVETREKLLTIHAIRAPHHPWRQS